MVEMTKKMQNSFDDMDDKQKIKMLYELIKYGEDDEMNNLIEDIANVKNDIENL